jgi:hypothetical protein
LSRRWQSQRRAKPARSLTLTLDIQRAVAMNIGEFLERASQTRRDRALKLLLSGALSPALGALPKRELELLILEALVEVEYVSGSPTAYELAQKLRITKSKARSLIYDRELRRQDTNSLDELAIAALKKPLLQNQGYAVALDIENPFLADHIRDRVRKRGFASDGSFSPTLIRLSADAAADLIDSYLTDSSRKVVKKVLAKELGKATTARELIARAISAGASVVAGKAGEHLADLGVELVSGFFEAHEDKLRSVIHRIVRVAGDRRGSDV